MKSLVHEKLESKLKLNPNKKNEIECNGCAKSDSSGSLVSGTEAIALRIAIAKDVGLIDTNEKNIFRFLIVSFVSFPEGRFRLAF